MKKSLITILIVVIAAAASLWYSSAITWQNMNSGTSNFEGNGCDFSVGGKCNVEGNYSKAGNFSSAGGTFTFNGVTCKDDQTIRKNIIGLLYCSNE